MSSAAVAVSFNAEALEHFSAFRRTVRAAVTDAEILSSFETFSAFIQKPSTLKAALLLLKHSRCDLLKKPSPRTLLAAFMVAHFPEDILEVSEEQMNELGEERALDRSCHEMAKTVETTFLNEESSLADCLTILSKFQDVFVEWKEFDRQRVMMTLANAHHQWVASLKHLEESRETTNDLESLEIMIASVKEQTEANKRRILQMGGPEGLEQVLASPPITIDLEQLILEAGSKKYWDDFAAELRMSPPKYDRIASILTEIRDRLKNLVPSRPDVQASIHTGLDIDFIRQMIEFNSFDSANFLRVFDTIWTHLKNFGAASAEAEWQAWRDSIMEQASTGSSTWDVLLPAIFNRFLKQLDLIEEATAHYRQILEESNAQADIPAPSAA